MRSHSLYIWKSLVHRWGKGMQQASTMKKEYAATKRVKKQTRFLKNEKAKLQRKQMKKLKKLRQAWKDQCHLRAGY